MKNRRKIMMWGCLLMVYLLTACHKEGGGKTGMASAVEVSSEILETGQVSMPEKETAMETVKESQETISKIAAEAETMPDLGKVGESDEADQREFTWLDQALAEGLGKEPEELTEDDYLSVTGLGILTDQQIDSEAKRVVQIARSGETMYTVVAFPDFSNVSIPVTIDVCDIVNCKNLERLHINCENVLVTGYETLAQLKQLTNLSIQIKGLFDTNQSNRNINEINDFSFIYQMPNLTIIFLENIKLSDDLSPLFSHHFKAITLRHCNVTENNFSFLDANAVYPDRLDLYGNQISDATIFTNMLWNWGENTVYSLNLGENPLIKLGDRLENETPSFETSDLMSLGQDVIGLFLDGTDFEEYEFSWYRD